MEDLGDQLPNKGARVLAEWEWDCLVWRLWPLIQVGCGSHLQMCYLPVSAGISPRFSVSTLIHTVTDYA